MLKRLLLIVFLAGLSGAAWGQDFGLDLGCCSQPINAGNIITPVNGGGIFDFYNPNNSPIIEMVFKADIGVNAVVDDTHFVCNTNGLFFLSCDRSFVDGILTFDFHGTNTLDGDEGPVAPDPDEPAQQEGITTLPAGCLPTEESPDQPDSAGCTQAGHFVVDLNTGDSTGLWGNIQLENTEIATTTATYTSPFTLPEPEVFSLLGLGLLVVGGIVRRQGPGVPYNVWPRR